MKINFGNIKGTIKKSIEWIVNKLRILVIPGFHGMPLYDVLKYFFSGFSKGYIIDRGAAVAFFVFLSIFPTTLVILNILPLLPIKGVNVVIMDTLRDLLPSGAFMSVTETVDEIMEKERPGLLSFSALLAFYFGSSAFRAFFRGFDMGVNHLGNIGFKKKQIYSMFIALVIGSLIIFSMALFVIGRDFLPVFFLQIGFDRIIFIFIINTVRWLMIIFTMLFAVSILYYFANPKRKTGKFKLFTPGSILSVMMMILGAFGFNFYIVNFSRFSTLYGSIGGIIIFMLWVYVNCLIVLIGFELNASIQLASNSDPVEAQVESENKD